MKVIQDPVKTCDKVYALIQSLNSQIRKRLEDPKSAGRESKSHLKLTPLVHVNQKRRFPRVFLRPAAVPQRDVGADAAALVQAGEGLPHEERPLRHQQDPRHLRLRQVRLAAQRLAGPGGHAGAVPAVARAGRHRHTAGSRRRSVPRLEDEALDTHTLPQTVQRCAYSLRRSLGLTANGSH